MRTEWQLSRVPCPSRVGVSEELLPCDSDPEFYWCPPAVPSCSHGSVSQVRPLLWALSGWVAYMSNASGPARPSGLVSEGLCPPSGSYPPHPAWAAWQGPQEGDGTCMGVFKPKLASDSPLHHWPRLTPWAGPDPAQGTGRGRQPRGRDCTEFRVVSVSCGPRERGSTVWPRTLNLSR